MPDFFIFLQDNSWRNRRSQKLDKMELLNLQSSLQSEIQAKRSIGEELSKTQSELIAMQKYDLCSKQIIVQTNIQYLNIWYNLCKS